MPCSIFCPYLSLLCLALHAMSRVAGTACDQCIIGNCHFSLVSCMSFKLQPFHSESDKLSIHRNGHSSVFFQRSQKHPYDWSPEDLISSILLGTPSHSPVDVGVAAGDDGAATPASEFWEGRPPRNRDFFKGKNLITPKFSCFSIFLK